MNFWNNTLFRCSRIPFWSNPCCKELIKSSQLDADDRPKTVPCQTLPMNVISAKQCCRQPIPTFSSTWTQVRFNRECPRLHRDVDFPNFDPYRKERFKDVRRTDWGAGDEKPGHTYAIGFFGLLCGAYATKTICTHFISYMGAAADVLALASIEVDLTKIAPGACLSYKWRGKPLFVKHRTQSDIDSEAHTPMNVLRDPATPDQRASNPEWLIVIGICTHLGCVPIPNSGDYPGGFYCPCHGSHYDNVGRTRKGPAPLNLEVPPYKFLSDSLVMVG